MTMCVAATQVAITVSSYFLFLSFKPHVIGLRSAQFAVALGGTVPFVSCSLRESSKSIQRKADSDPTNIAKSVSSSESKLIC